MSKMTYIIFSIVIIAISIIINYGTSGDGSRMHSGGYYGGGSFSGGHK